MVFEMPALSLAHPQFKNGDRWWKLFQELRCPYLRGGLDCNHTQGSGCHAKESSGHSFALLVRYLWQFIRLFGHGLAGL